MKKTFVISILALIFTAFYVDTSFAQTRIRFARGRTSASVSSTIAGNGERHYVLGAQSGQTLTANVTSRNGCVVLGNRSKAHSFRTDRGDNWIDIYNECGRSTTFTLTVSIY